MNEDSFALNIQGVSDLVQSPDNKTSVGDFSNNEGVKGAYEDVLDLPMEDEELLKLKSEWELKHDGYYPKVKPRQERNKLYYAGRQNQSDGQADKVIGSNLIFEAEETFIPQALSKNPEPVVWSDDTDEGKKASNDVKTMLQYHADVLCLRRKLGVMTRHWSVYLTAVVKHGWDSKIVDGVEKGDIKTDIRKPKNFVFDPDGYVDEYGNFVGEFLGERIDSSAKKLIELYPEHKDYITEKAEGKLGTKLVRTEWWTDEYCFTTLQDKVLDKHKNQYFNYAATEQTDEEGNVTQSATPAVNHFASPKMPYTFLSVFSFQETPHDTTNLIEQNVPNQDRIVERDAQISKNLRNGNNGLVLSGVAFNEETAQQAAVAAEDGDPILVPNGDVERAVKRLPSSDIPSAVFTSLENDKVTLRQTFGTQGLTSQADTKDTTARGMILNQSHDSSRIGGGIGDALEQVADNIFNWWLQLYCVFYDQPHYGAVMGNGRAVEYVTIVNSNLDRHFVVSVAPNSMKPKDEITQTNQAIERWNNKAIDPIGFMKELNDPDPIESAKRLAMWITNPQQYMLIYFPEIAPATDTANAPNPPNAPGIPTPVDESLGATPASASLSQVPINTPALPT